MKRRALSSVGAGSSRTEAGHPALDALGPDAVPRSTWVEHLHPAIEHSSLLPEGLTCLELVRRSRVGRDVVNLAAIGDTSFSGAVALSQKALDPLEEVSGFLRNCDLTLANLEGVILDNGATREPFTMGPETARRLRQGGVRVVHLANNHVLDQGVAGLSSTLEALTKEQIVVLGAGMQPCDARRLVRTEIGDLTIGWLACGRTLQTQLHEGPCFWELEHRLLENAVEELSPTVDVLVVSIHAGYMYLDYPAPEHRELCLRLCELGSKLVLMHHPHVLQGVEVTPEGGVICYSLGNFLLDWQEGNVRVDTMVQEQQRGAVFHFELDRQGVSGLTVIPTVIESRSRARWARGDEGRQILERLGRISNDLAGPYLPMFERQRAERNTGLTLATLWKAARAGRVGETLGLLARARPKHILMVARWLGKLARRAS